MIDTLSKTKSLMTSKIYKRRFVAEYWQTKIRYEKLKTFNNKIELWEDYNVGEAPAHDCPLSLLKEQQQVMGFYLSILEKRAIIEDIDLYDSKYENEETTIGGESNE